MPRDFDDLLSKDHKFTVRGETFAYKEVRPEILTAFEPSTNGKGEDDVWALMDEQILLFLEDSEHERWKTLRAREKDPVTIAQINAILTWLMEEQTGRPTQTPSPSASGRGRTAASSTAG
jgi:hypothetical protein